MNKYGAPARTWGDGRCLWKFPPSATHPNAESIKLSVDGKYNEVHVFYFCNSEVKGADGEKEEF